MDIMLVTVRPSLPCSPSILSHASCHSLRQDTGYYVLQNFIFDDDDQTSSTTVKGTWDPSGGWEATGFVFSDGTGMPPESVAPLDMSMCTAGTFYDLVLGTCRECSPGTWSSGGTDPKRHRTAVQKSHSKHLSHARRCGKQTR